MEFPINPEDRYGKLIREIKTTNFVPRWANDEERKLLADMPNVGFNYDPTNGASKVAQEILDDIDYRYGEPLEDQSLRDDEMKGAILKHLKYLLREAADKLEEEGY